MKYILLFLVALVAIPAWAEGTRELAPNRSINIDGDSTSDMTAIYIGSNDYGNFARFDSPNSAKLQIRILDPNQECIMFGFSKAITINSTAGIPYRFIVRDPNGQIIYESATYDEFDAPIQSWDEAYAGPRSLVGDDGYDDVFLTSTVLTSAGWTGEGDYYVEFERMDFGFQAFLIPFWDITVGDCSGTFLAARPGRVWSDLWALFTPWYGFSGSHFDRPFNGAFYIVAPDEEDEGAGFVTRMDFNNSRFRAAAFNVALNSFGATNTGDVTSNRRSVAFFNTIIGQYPVFLNDPVDLYRTAELGELEILGAEGCLPDDYCFLARSTVTGEIELLLDLDGSDGIYTPDTRDVLLNFIVDTSLVGEIQCIEWDGLDGLGNIYTGNDYDSVTVISSFRQGIYHFPVYDVEINLTGFSLEAVRPTGLAPKLYYDDSTIPFFSGTGSPNTNLAGCASPCHTWTGSVTSSSYGNQNTINSWWYARTLLDEKQVAIKFNKFTDLDLRFCPEDPQQVEDSVITQSGDHFFYHISRAGCDSIIRVHADVVRIQPWITSDLTHLNCFDTSATISGLSSDPAGQLEFQWSGPEDQAIDDPSRAVIEVSRPGIYRLDLTETSLGCLSSDSIEITGDYERPFIESFQLPVLGCYPIAERVIATVKTPVPNDYQITYFTIDGNITEQSGTREVWVDQPGHYIATIQNRDNGCTSSDSFIIYRDTLSYLTLSGANEVYSDFCEPQTLQLSMNTTALDSFAWSPSRVLSCESCPNPQFLADSSYAFVMTATDTNGCIATHEVEVVLDRDFKLFVPSAFSPNNDGINDELLIFSSPCAVEILEFYVFDRWGNKMFERRDFLSTEMTEGWDGVFKDRPSPQDVYVYQVSVRTYSGEVVHLSGDVQIVR